MAFIGTKELTRILGGPDGVVTPFDASKLKNGAYELSLGQQVFQTGVKPRAVKNLSRQEKIYIEQGQFALLMTEEKVKVPEDKIAFITIKASVKFEGLVNVSGFHIDPGFEGRLLFSVYNAGPSTIVLSQGTSYFPMWFAELKESQKYEGVHKNQDGIPDDPVRALSQGELASPSELSRRIDDVKHLKTKIEWVFLAILTLLIGVCVKLWTEEKKLKDAIEVGYRKKSDEISSDSLYTNMLLKVDTLNKRIDSLVRIIEAPKTTNSNPKKKQ